MGARKKGVQKKHHTREKKGGAATTSRKATVLRRGYADAKSLKKRVGLGRKKKGKKPNQGKPPPEERPRRRLAINVRP